MQDAHAPDVSIACPQAHCATVLFRKYASALLRNREQINPGTQIVRGSKAIAIDNGLRGTLRNFGLKVGMVGKVKFEARQGG